MFPNTDYNRRSIFVFSRDVGEVSAIMICVKDQKRLLTNEVRGGSF